MTGVKYDKGKPKCGLMAFGFARALIEVSKVSTMGAEKYGANTWQGVSSDRYLDALFRHLLAWLNGEMTDPESGLSHLAHVTWNSLALLQKLLTEDNDEKTST